MDVVPPTGSDPGDFLRGEGRDPHGAIPVGEYTARAEAASGGVGDEVSLPKAFQPPVGRHPDISFTVFKEVPDDIREQAIVLRELLGLGAELRDGDASYSRWVAYSAETIASRADPE